MLGGVSPGLAAAGDFGVVKLACICIRAGLHVRGHTHWQAALRTAWTAQTKEENGGVCACGRSAVAYGLAPGILVRHVDWLWARCFNGAPATTANTLVPRDLLIGFLCARGSACGEL